MNLPGEPVRSSLPARRRFLVPLPAELDAEALERLGGAVHHGRVPHAEIEAESRVVGPAPSVHPITVRDPATRTTNGLESSHLPQLRVRSSPVPYPNVPVVAS